AEWQIPGIFRSAGSFRSRAGHRRIASVIGAGWVSGAWIVLASRWSTLAGGSSEWTDGKAESVESFDLGRTTKKDSRRVRKRKRFSRRKNNRAPSQQLAQPDRFVPDECGG